MNPEDSEVPEAVGGEERAWRVVLWSVEGIGAVRYGQLVEHFGSAAAAFAAGPAACAEVVGRPSLARQLERHWGESPRRRLEEALGRGECQVLGRREPGYPEVLARAEGPPWLFVRGAVEALSAPLLAVVGTRRIRNEGARLARRVVAWCAERGFGVVSGGALGVDAEAHRTALKLALPTVVVLPAGLGRATPPSHEGLFESVCAAGGCLVSEHPPWRSARPELFVRRNRLISGLAVSTIVVRAPSRSGALITASWARRQGRPVYAVPGVPDDPTAAGCLELLRDGARLLTAAHDLPLAPAGDIDGAAVSERAEPPVPAAPLPLDGAEARLLGVLRQGAATTEVLASETRLPVGAVLAALTRLALAGHLETLGPGLYRARS